jgi:hypothetical protein
MASKTTVFVSSDLANYANRCDFIIMQSKLDDSTFEVSGHSSKLKGNEGAWQVRAQDAIARAEKFVVILGPMTRYSVRVMKEVAIATTLGKPKCQILGYSSGSHDWAIADAGEIYDWDWDKVKTLLA